MDRHPIQIGALRLRQARQQAAVALLIVIAAPVVGAVTALVSLLVRLP